MKKVLGISAILIGSSAAFSAEPVEKIVLSCDYTRYKVVSLNRAEETFEVEEVFDGNGTVIFDDAKQRFHFDSEVFEDYDTVRSAEDDSIIAGVKSWWTNEEGKAVSRISPKVFADPYTGSIEFFPDRDPYELNEEIGNRFYMGTCRPASKKLF